MCVRRVLHNVADHARKDTWLTSHRFIASCKKVFQKSLRKRCTHRENSTDNPKTTQSDDYKVGHIAWGLPILRELFEVVAEILDEIPSESSGAVAVKEILHCSRSKFEADLACNSAVYTVVVKRNSRTKRMHFPYRFLCMLQD